MEALGLASADKDRAKLEQRLLTAVSDLQLAQKERDAISRPDAAVDRSDAALFENVAEAATRRREWMWKRSCAAMNALVG